MPVLAPPSVTPGTLLPCSQWQGGTLSCEESGSGGWWTCSLFCSWMVLGIEHPAVETAGYSYQVRLRGLCCPRMGCDVERACPCVSLVAGLLLCHPCRRDGGYREQGLPSAGPGQVEEVRQWLLRCRGTLCVRPPLYGLVAISLCWLVMPQRCATERVSCATQYIHPFGWHKSDSLVGYVCHPNG
jgi:hypothetical protein